MSYAYDNDEFSRYYDSFVAEHVSNDIYWTDTVNHIYTELIQRTFIDNQQTIVVDLGCGTGKDLIAFQNHFTNRNIKFIGIDHSQAMLNRAKEKLMNTSNNSIEFLHGSITDFAKCIETKPVDCILLPAGTFHHLITDNERQDLINNIQQTLRHETGLFILYLMPDSCIHFELTNDQTSENRLKHISAENSQINNHNEWICKHTFTFDIPPKVQLSWQLRTCSVIKLIDLFISNNFEIQFCCLNGRDVLPYNENMSYSLTNNSTTAILVFRTRKNTN